MDTLVTGIAQLLPFAFPLVAAVVWLGLDRRGRLDLSVRAVAALALCGLLVLVAGLLHYDPRPFVETPSLRPLFPHPADNGFPSDHTAFTAAIALLVMIVRRRVGLVLLVGSVLVGAARVLAHVHHPVDIVAGVVVAVLAVGATLAVRPPSARATTDADLPQPRLSERDLRSRS
ncbi:undecaprenyl-diphosphatase [Terracoccus luteus]|uniref:Undecaprenyl-diphosphatase n=1 Tax=Terracoccus luteus TaxID=53356 RepID=A0A495Y3A9_9MICO|nr:phosphatase PAP2 family protein [Terracoccus luteus]RKT79944.1 undecaprenyl-diphosphatase [Terracoccus luteus]